MPVQSPEQSERENDTPEADQEEVDQGIDQAPDQELPAQNLAPNPAQQAPQPSPQQPPIQQGIIDQINGPQQSIIDQIDTPTEPSAAMRNQIDGIGRGKELGKNPSRLESTPDDKARNAPLTPPPVLNNDAQPTSTETNDFSKPDSVYKEPNAKLPNPAVPGSEDELKKRASGDDINPRAQVPAYIPGAQKLNDVAARAQAAKDKYNKTKENINAAKKAAATGDVSELTKQGVQKIVGDSKAGQALAGAAKDAADLAQVFEGNFLRAIPIVKKYGKPLAILALMFIIVCSAIGAGLYEAVQGAGDASALVGTGNIISGSYCQGMMNYTDVQQGGTTTRIFTSGTTGKFSEESPLDPNTGHIIEQENPGPVSFIDYYMSQPADVRAQWAPYYITARWPYIASTFGPGGDKSGPAYHETRNGFAGLPTSNLYQGKRVIIFSPKTKKAVLGIILEFGPQPWTGSEGHPASEYSQQLANWNTGSSNGFRIQDPPGFIERVAGGPPSLEKVLGINNQDTIVYGFAPPELQNTAPGPINCTVVTAGSGPTNGATQPLPVPPTNQSAGGQCGIASTISVVRYYNPAYNDTAYYDAANNAVTKGATTLCVSPSYINDHSAGKVSDFTLATVERNKGFPTATFDNVKQSVLSGDPVIMYSAPDAFYPPTAQYNQHIFVITGYNASTDTFDIMSPNGKADIFNGVIDGIGSPKGQKITADYLMSKTTNIDSAYGGHSFMIRKKYLQVSP